MRIRKLLDWRKLLIYSHRWLGIAVGLVFLAGCVCGVILLYAGVPHLTAVAAIHGPASTSAHLDAWRPSGLSLQHRPGVRPLDRRIGAVHARPTTALDA